MSVNLLWKFHSFFLLGYYPWYIYFSAAVQITRYIPLHLFVPGFWGWEGGKLEVAIPLITHSWRWDTRAMMKPLSWEGESVFCEPCLVPKSPKADGSRGKWETLSQGRPSGSGLLSLHGTARLRSSRVSWIRTPEELTWEICAPLCLARGFSCLPEGSKPACPECTGRPGWAKRINTQCSMNLMYVSHTAFLISYIFIVEKGNKLQFH